MREKIVTACEVGSSSVRVGCALLRTDTAPRLIGLGSSPSLGVRRGRIVDLPEVTHALRNAFAEAERTAGVRLSQSFVVIGGPQVELIRSHGSIAVSRADGTISDEDTRRAMEQAQAVSLPQNKIIIHAQPLSWSVDTEQGIDDPVGLKGVRLEVSALLVLALSPLVRSLQKAVHETGREVEGWMYAPLALEQALLSKKQKEFGVAIATIGAATTTISVFRERNLHDVIIVPMGGAQATHDVAISLKTSLDIAERIKTEYGSAVSGTVSKREHVVLADWGLDHLNVSRHSLARTIEGCSTELSRLVEKELRPFIKEKSLPGGIVLTGGGAQLKNIVELFKRELALPCHVGRVREIESTLTDAFDPAYASVVGALLWAGNIEGTASESPLSSWETGSIVKTLKQWIQELLP